MVHLKGLAWGQLNQLFEGLWFLFNLALCLA